MSTIQPSVEIRNVTVTFSRWGQSITALDQVSLTIPKGQWVMLVGHNGSGKSTLLKVISGRLSPTKADNVTISGKKVEEMSSSDIAGQVFLVHQDPLMGTAPILTLFENLMVADYKAKSASVSKSELAQKYKALLEPLGLADRLNQLTKYFSGGERQLIALLIARLRKVSILLLDEPLASLDPAKAQLCIEIINKFQEEGNTIIQITHDTHLATSVGDRTIVMAHGKLVYDEIKGRNINDIYAY